MGWTGDHHLSLLSYVFSVKHWSCYKSMLTFRKRSGVVWFRLKRWAFSKLGASVLPLAPQDLSDTTISRVWHDNNPQCKISLQVKHSLNRLGYKIYYCSKVWVRYYFLKIFLTEVSYAFQDCIYLIKNMSKMWRKQLCCLILFMENVFFFFQNS